MAISTEMTSCVFLVEICLCVYFQICLSSKTEKISRELIVIITTKTEHSHPIAPLYSFDFEQDCMQTKKHLLKISFAVSQFEMEYIKISIQIKAVYT